jgi:hypothetical protein
MRRSDCTASLRVHSGKGVKKEYNLYTNVKVDNYGPTPRMYDLQSVYIPTQNFNIAYTCSCLAANNGIKFNKTNKPQNYASNYF